VTYRDPPPRRITFDEWGELFEQIPDELIQRYHYFHPEMEPRMHANARESGGKKTPVHASSRQPESQTTATDRNLQSAICNPQSAISAPYPWSTYLFPPQTFATYGARHLRRLKFDNSLAALRMWGFVMNETERLFRARQVGKKVIATMGDLGGTPPMVLATGTGLPFYPDCIWWVPFMNESSVLFDAAATMGLGDAVCYSRASLGAFIKKSYFPDPVLCIAGTGASCDDYGAVESLVEGMGQPVLWFELPLRKDPAMRNDETADQRRLRQTGGFGAPGSACASCERYSTTPAGTEYQESALEFLVEQFQNLRGKLEELFGITRDDDRLHAAIRRVNRVRRSVARIKEKVYSAPVSIFPALEMMVIEFGNLHFYSDIDEWTAILEHIEETVDERLKTPDECRTQNTERRMQNGVNPQSPIPVVWVTPPADPLLLTYAEDQGLRVVGTEYVISQSLFEIPEDGDPIRALAETFLNASLIGSSRARAQSVIEQAKRYQAEGVVISGILGGSHCATETSLIRDFVQQELDLPVLAFDVPSPSGIIQSQIKTRMDAFIEVLMGRR
jgi:benzoyl-CoA reductase/2-hydroxyglutaryl-CoA dehydratase subunit BcrC/BadD/HgdB